MVEINVDISEMTTALEDMQAALNRFKTISEGAFSNEIAVLKAMNVDFIDVYARLLECTKGWGTGGLSENINTYYQSASTVLADMIAADEATSKAIRG